MRKKIRTKSLNNTRNLNLDLGNNLNITDKPNIFDKIENKIIKSLICFGLILLLLIWSVIPIVILALCGIDYSTFSLTEKVILLTVTDFLFVLLILFIYRKDIIPNFKDFFGKNFVNNFEEALKYWLIGLAIMYVSNLFIYTITSGGMASNEESVRSLIDISLPYMIFELVIYAPITEELIFRKSIRDIFTNKYLYIFVSGFIFGCMHVLSSVTALTDLLYLIPYSALGCAFASLYYKTDNIFSSISMHALHNGFALVLYLFSI